MILVLPVLEVMIKPDLIDPFAESIKRRVKNDLGITLDEVRTKKVYIFDVELTKEELELARDKIFMDPQVEVASFEGVKTSFDYLIHVSWKPGVTDTTGRVAIEALQDLFKRKFKEHEKVYTAFQICVTGNITREQASKIARLYANEMVQEINIWTRDDKIVYPVPKVDMRVEPKVEYINLNVPDEELMRISEKRKLALNLKEMKAIQEYYNTPRVIKEREKMGLKPMPTDVELEILAQTWSEHCKHKIFNALITDIKGNIFEGIPDPDRAIEEILNDGGNVEKDRDGNPTKIVVNSIFKTYIKTPALELKKRYAWLKSILKDNAGIVDFDDQWLYTLKWESHNSPSAKEPYGGAYTGIVGVYRDPMGSGRGGKIFAGFWSFHVGSPFYDGELDPELHPRQILEGVRKGVEDGGNRSGNPTTWGFVYFHDGFIGKPYIGVGASSLIPKSINGEPGWEKIIRPGASNRCGWSGGN